MEVLRFAITGDTEVQRFLVNEVLGLSPTQQKDFYDVLQQVPLSNVVSVARTIVDRLKFLSGLGHILFETEAKKLIRERTQLHRILAEHVWLFGDEWSLAADDVSLKRVLVRHHELLGVQKSAFDAQPDAKRKLTDIPDLVLYRMACHRPGELDHLVVELKAPKIVCAEREFDQIERYAAEVVECADFDKEKTKWKFVLISTSFKGSVYDRKAKQRGRPPGLFIEHDRYEVWALSWSQVVQEAEGRLQFLKDRLELNITEEKTGLDYFREHFSQYLPASMIDDSGSGGEVSADEDDPQPDVI